MLRGLARYTLQHAAGALAARFVRSDLAHARVMSVDLSASRAVPGVVAAYAMADLDGVLPATPAALDAITNRDGSAAPVAPRPALARDRVRFAGEAVALVIAETDAAASDGVEAALIEYHALPAASSLALPPGDTAIHDGAEGDVAFDWAGGDAAAAGQAFARAAHVVAAGIAVPRILGLPLEPMSAVASYDPAAARWTLVAPSQGVHAVQRELAAGYLGVEPGRLRVITPDVGGGFGIRIHALPEQAALLGAARLLGRAVAWCATRTESNLIEPHARDMLIDAELALDGDGAFLGLRASAQCSLGAYVHPGARATPTASLLFGLQGAYRMPALSLRVRGRYTNTTPTGPFRGAGQPEGTYVLERLIDLAAHRMGLDPVELRRRNALRASDFPYRCASGHVVDSGDAAGLLDQAAGWLDAWTPAGCVPEIGVSEGRRPEGRAAGNDVRDSRVPGVGPLRRGRGLALYLKVNGMGRQERAEVVVSAADGMIRARVGSQSNGQGHATAYAGIAAAGLDLAPGDITVVQGDTDLVAFGTGTGASSALATTGAGVALSCADLLSVARAAAARCLAVPEDGLDYAAGSFSVPGTNSFITLRRLAEEAGGVLLGRSSVPVSLTYTVGCHACHVGIEPDTGLVHLLGYAAFDDLGLLLQPAIAQGQVHGGVAQGVGQALLEVMQYDQAAQPVSASLMDYCLPRASDLPELHCGLAQTPGAGSLRVRGAGEAGAVASMAAVVNAAAAAIGGGALLDAPLTPQRVWQALRGSALPSLVSTELTMATLTSPRPGQSSIQLPKETANAA